MSDANKPSDDSQAKPKKLNLGALLPAKVSIDTSIGTLYVRHAYSSDWKFFNIEDVVELGRVSVQRLCNRVEDKHDSSTLPDDELASLTDADYQALVPAIARHSGWRVLPEGAGLKELGDAVREEKQAETERHEKMLGNLRKSIDSSYSFLGKGVLEKLQEQMAGVADIRNALAGTESIQAALRTATLADESWKKSLMGISAFEKATAQIELPRAFDIPKLIMPPRPEDTPMGRATIKSAENSRQVAEKMDALVVVVAGLNQTMIQDILPAWFKQIEEDQRAARDAFDQAARGLWWTKWAVIASVLVTILATWWQVDVARSIDRENSEQQKRVEAVLREQLTAQQKLIEQQAKDAVAMREIVATLKPPVPIAAPKKPQGKSH